MNTDHTYLAYFDTLGFECILDCTEYEKVVTFDILKNGESSIRFPLREMTLRAQVNPQRFPEIWIFDSDVALEDLIEISKSDPQMLANAIRDHGKSVFITPRQKVVIK